MRAALVLMALLASSPARAEPAANLAYAELGGKGGLYGLGYERQLTARFAAGAAVSYARPDGQTRLALSPYVAAYPLRRGRHAGFVHAGPMLVHLRTPSPVPEWDGASDTGVGGQLSVGYEFAGPVRLRSYLMLAAGKNGVVPWAGVSLGWAF